MNHTDTLFEKGGFPLASYRRKRSGQAIMNVFIILLIVVVFVSLCFLIWKIWDVFGFWRIAGAGFANLAIALYFLQFAGSGRSEQDGSVTFNPNEIPKFFGLFGFLCVGYYLYDHLNKVPDISSNDYTFGVVYLLYTTVLCCAFAGYRLVRDRNDFITVTAETLSYKDNEKTGEFRFSDIVSVEKVKQPRQRWSLAADLALLLTFRDGETHTIFTNQMNFNLRDLLGVEKEIEIVLALSKPVESQPPAEEPAADPVEPAAVGIAHAGVGELLSENPPGENVEEE